MGYIVSGKPMNKTVGHARTGNRRRRRQVLDSSVGSICGSFERLSGQAKKARDVWVGGIRATAFGSRTDTRRIQAARCPR